MYYLLAKAKEESVVEGVIKPQFKSLYNKYDGWLWECNDYCYILELGYSEDFERIKIFLEKSGEIKSVEEVSYKQSAFEISQAETRLLLGGGLGENEIDNASGYIIEFREEIK